MRAFRFCPECGRALRARAGSHGMRCAVCERSWYRGSFPSVGCAIVRGGRALATVRAREPERGRLDVPGGFLEPGEHPLDGVRREVREELGVEVEVAADGWISMGTHRYGPEGDFVLALGFRARLVAGEPTPSDDVAALRWVGADDLDALDFAWSHDRELLRLALGRG